MPNSWNVWNHRVSIEFSQMEYLTSFKPQDLFKEQRKGNVNNVCITIQYYVTIFVTILFVLILQNKTD